ncbi:hypothetical protein BGX29_004277 [Mortierella sp. GBA35]|nr:hypothetical protein BGX29_004277 [Mortierella sp. GBA35]
MTDFAQERPSLRSRGASNLKLNLMSSSHFMPQQHPLDTGLDDRDMDIDLDEMVGYDTSLPSVPSLTKSSSNNNMNNNKDSSDSVPFVSAHPSPDVSDESDSERERRHGGLGLGLLGSKPNNKDESIVHAATTTSSSVSMSVTPPVPVSHKKRVSHHAVNDQDALSYHLLLSPIPIPQQSHARRTPPQSPLNSFSNSHSHSFKRSSFSSMQTPPGSATAAFPVPCSDPVEVEALIRENVQAHMRSHATDKAYFWSLGKLSEFSFSDRFVRSPVFDIKETASAAPASTEPSSLTTDAASQAPNKSIWRLRLYPHGRGDRHRDSEYIGLYLQQESTGPAINRRGSAIPHSPATNAAAAFSSSVPAPFSSRSSISSGSRRSVSGMSLPMTRRHVTLFLATEAGDCLAKQDLVEWFSGSEGGLGFPRFALRKTVLDAVKKDSLFFDDEEEEDEGEMNIVAGVIFHEL